ncbi:MAG: DUF6588 family protein [Pseudobdellovibrionaceae bacterium]
MIRGLFIPFCLTFLAPTLAFAQAVSFLDITDSEFEDITKEFSGNFMHHSVQGASPLGDIFGFEIGLVGGQQGTPKIDTLAKRAGGSGISNLYHAGLLGAVSIPFGITGEVVLLPKMSASEAELSMTSLALKLSLNTELLKVIPFNLAFRGFQTNSKFSFKQAIAGYGDAAVEDKSTVTGFQLMASPKLPIVEPYAGVGILNAENELSSSVGSVFADGSSSKEKSLSATQMLLGINVNLLFFRLGAEYSSAFGANSITGKLAFGF